MDKKRKGLRLYQLTAVIIPAVVILCIFFLPVIFNSNSELVPVSFIVKKQSSYNGVVSICGSFEQEIHQQTLWMYAENAEVGLKVYEKQFQFNGKEQTPSQFQSSGSGWYTLPSAEIGKGDMVEFTVNSYYRQEEEAVANLLKRLYIGDGSGLYQLLIKQIGFFGIVMFFAMTAGIIYLVEGFIDIAFGIIEEGKRIAIFGFYLFAGGLWCLPDIIYPYISLLIFPGWIAAMVDFSGLLLFPIALAVLMRYFMRRKGVRHVLNGILALEILLAVICIAFQFTGKADFIEQQPAIGIAALVCLITAIIGFLAELRCYREKYMVLLFFTIVPVFISEILDAVNVLMPFMPRRFLMKYSFGISVFILILQLGSYAQAELEKAKAWKRLEHELEETRISVILSQIQPHFLYNVLSGIQQLCNTTPQKASEALEHFSYYLRGNFYFLSDQKMIPFEKEAEHVQDYLYLEKMRYGERLEVKWEIGFTDFLISPLTLQPIVENAIRHGIMKKKSGGKIFIKSEAIAEGICVTVKDDGIGFDPNAVPGDARPHVGLENVMKRLKAQCGGSLEISSEFGKGTEVKIILAKEKVTA